METRVHLCTRGSCRCTENSPPFTGPPSLGWDRRRYLATHPVRSPMLMHHRTPGHTFNERFLIPASRCFDKRVNGSSIIKSARGVVESLARQRGSIKMRADKARGNSRVRCIETRGRGRGRCDILARIKSLN